MFVTMLALLLAAPQPGAAPTGSTRLAGERASDDPSKIVCKRFAKTGSLVGTVKTCKTKADWERERDAYRQQMTSGGGACAQQGGASC